MPSPLAQLSLNLIAATAMVAITVMLHFFGLLALTRLTGRAHERLRPHENPLRQAAMILLIVFGIFALHTIQIWLYAVLYLGLGELRTFEEALYFSTVTFVTLGYGDVVLSPNWRVLSAIEGANGTLLVAWSTAYLLTVTTRLRLLEHQWLEPKD
ncbi:MAG: two pore domain potassium channel family protein [Hyphomonadaceae bacterium]|nr:two pore domain potassium channel family protein [Hyphomonadaceae bacterium]